jgi:hypothetical protein
LDTTLALEPRDKKAVDSVSLDWEELENESNPALGLAGFANRIYCMHRQGGGLLETDGWVRFGSIAIIDLSRVNEMAPAKPIVGRKRKYFTVEEANKALPLVKRIVADIVHQYRVVEDLEQRLSMVSRERRRPSNDLYSEELAQSQAEFEAETTKLTTYVEELRRLGVELKGPDGLCDFCSIMDGREVFLCWRLGEPEVMFWHELDAGFAGRQPLTEPARTAAADDELL